MSQATAAARAALLAAFPYTIPIFAGFSFLGMAYGIYMGAEGFSPHLSDAHEPADLRGLGRVFDRAAAARAVFAAARIRARLHRQRAPSLLRHFHARSVPRARREDPIPHLRHVRREFFDQLHGKSAAGRQPRLVLLLGHAAQSPLLVRRRDSRRPLRLAALV